MEREHNKRKTIKRKSGLPSTFTINDCLTAVAAPLLPLSSFFLFILSSPPQFRFVFIFTLDFNFIYI